MATKLEQIFALTALSLARQCRRSLLRGPCVHTKGHALYSRHSHTWQPGDARYLVIDDKCIDMETGEITGFYGDLGQEVIDKIIGDRGSYHRKPEQDPAKLERARKVLEMQYGFDLPDTKQNVHTLPPAGYDWYYEGTTKAFGIDSDGHTVAFDFTTGEVARIYSQNQRRKAVAMAGSLGPAIAARNTGIPRETIRSWSRRSK